MHLGDDGHCCPPKSLKWCWLSPPVVPNHAHRAARQGGLSSSTNSAALAGSLGASRAAERTWGEGGSAPEDRRYVHSTALRTRSWCLYAGSQGLALA